MKHTVRRLLWIPVLLAFLLSGCGGAPSAEPPETVTLPAPSQAAASWGREETQNFPAGPAYTLPDPRADTGDFGEEPTVIPWVEPSDVPEISRPFDPYGESWEDLPTDPDPEAPATEPPETQAPDFVPDGSLLERELRRALSGLSGTWSVYAKNLDTGETVCIRDEPMVAASLIKLFVAGAYYETDPQAEDSRRCGQVDLMIRVSSNDACNSLIDSLGMSTVNRFIRSQGWSKSSLNRKMLQQSQLENYTSARECGQVLEAIYRGDYVSAAASARLLQNLKDQERTWKIPAGVPRGTVTANKTGELSDTENDVCIVWSPGGVYILCILANDLPNVYTAREEFVKLSALVYDYFTNPAASMTPEPADPGRTEVTP